ncbi:sulfite exporter TauE/SafE family protein [Shewanella livingstonensis]|uniref:Probable membrane transporter protein n=1 Tax=Shewanella livingstonensis TaxID=150120 RepID=A0A3G8LYJ6_9GAMM|nr:sulfite exporter TauE/SafE family protein [Shewanella livingstonensis]AZG74759.1 sulfite exporter TauE/SafE family protein [Shewanella livingstonensis]
MMSFIDPTTLILASIIVFFGALTQSLIGFGLAVVASPLLYIVNPQLVPVPIIVMGFAISAMTLFRERGHLQFNGLQYALLGRIPGGFLGAGLLLFAPQAILGLVIAAIVFIAVILSIFRFTAPINRLSLFIAGVFSGIFGNIAAIGGPPMAILLAGRDASQFRAALSAFFVFSSLIALAILAIVGLVEVKHLWLSLLLLPSVVAGYLVSGRLIGRVDKDKTRTATLILCSISATILVIKSTSALI